MPVQALLLKDATVTIESYGTDDGSAGPGDSTVDTLCVDRINVKQSRDTTDVSCKQDAVPIKRVVKYGWQIDCEMKLERGGSVIPNFQSEEIVKFDISASGYTLSGIGIVTNIEATIDNPSTFQFTIEEYGSVLTVTTS